MKKFLSVMLAITLCSLTSSVFAEEDMDSDNKGMYMTEMKKGSKLNKGHDDILADLDEETQEKVKALREAHMAEVSEIMESRDADMTDEEKAELREEIDALREAHQEELKEVLEDYPEALEKLEEHKEMMKEKREEVGEKTDKDREAMREKREEKMEEGEEMMKEKTEGRGEKRKAYKKKFAEKLENRLDTIPQEKLENVLSKIDMFIEKFETKENITDEKRENVLSQLEALRELVEEAISE